jgi:hypothetical protein
MRALSLAAVAMLAAALQPRPAVAQLPPSETLSFVAVADTFVDDSSPTKNFNAETRLRVDAAPVCITYLRFAVTGVGGRPVLGARLRLGVSGDSAHGGTAHVGAGTAWDEATVTYNTRPPLGGPGLHTLGAVDVGDVADFDLHTAIAGDGLWTVAIDTTSTDGVSFLTRTATSGQKPTLVLTVAAGPEPAVAIAQPADGAAFFDGDTITLQGHASDVVDGTLDAAIAWSAVPGGLLGTGATITTTLPEGTYVITASVVDSDGFGASDQVTITVGPPPPDNTEPLVTITAPANGQTVGATQAITFTGTATDLEEGSLTTALVWTSSRDGRIGTGRTFTRTLSVGTHTITAAVTDAGGLEGHAQRTVTVQPPAGQVGFPGVSFGSGVDENDNRATAQKPESKLWHHDGIWWAALFNPTAGGGHRIHALDPRTNTWLDTGVVVDPRPTSREDVLWDGQRLYVASRFGGSPAQNRLYRFSYEAAAARYRLDPGFPVNIAGGGTEALTLAKDSTGTLWIAYTLGKKVLVNRTMGSDSQWGTPFVVPVPEGTTVASDDIAAVQALPGKIGVFWSNQSTKKDYFAVHPDGAAATASWKLEIAAQGGSVADDHFNLKTASDGRVFVAVKTSFSGSNDTLVGLLVRSAAGTWSPLHRVTTGQFGPTRPQCVLDEEAGLVYVFYSPGKSGVFYKASALSAISFPSGIGTAFIDSTSTTDINNPTTAKQNVDAGSGIVIVASSPKAKRYWHNTLGVPLP